METEDVSPDDKGQSKDDDGGQQEYNPLIVRRSNRAIKPTKDIDLYLLGAQFGVDLEGSDVDTSDGEFSPQEDDGKGGSGGSWIQKMRSVAIHLSLSLSLSLQLILSVGLQ